MITKHHTFNLEYKQHQISIYEQLPAKKGQPDVKLFFILFDNEGSWMPPTEFTFNEALTFALNVIDEECSI